MSLNSVKEYLKKYNKDKNIFIMDKSTATVDLAAKALGVEPARIAKSIAFQNGEGALLVVTAGDTKIDNKKFKDEFGFKAKMLSAEDTLKFTGHEVGGVCPFDIPEGTSVYLDESMKRFQTIFPACGSSDSVIELNLAEIEQLSQCIKWVDVCKGWN